ncbi:MAG TPA: zinc ribbon domain-containing protein [Gemmatimonadales bacterium]|nr:zinc ribbon domain-containing protein [Gemmatimonadales bacterium]
MRICPKCSTKCEDTWRYCPKDGTDLTAALKATTPIAFSKTCPRCGKQYDSRVKFCQQDGAELVRPTRG